MAKDFRAGQVRTTQIIGSGSDPGKPSILIVSASDSPGFGGEAMDSSALLTSVGSDVFMFVTGSKSHSHGSGLQGVTLFGGDVVISGTMFAEHLIAEVEATTTGSLMVSGSLIVSQSATIHEGMVVNESGEGGSENDFRVESENKTHAFFVDTSTDQVLILSGGGTTSYNEAAGADVSFYVSGAIDSKDGLAKGASVFGGDVIVSGSLLDKFGDAFGGHSVIGWYSGSGGGVGHGAGAGWISTSGSLAISGTLSVASEINHIGDTGTSVSFSTDSVELSLAGDSGLLLDRSPSSAAPHTTFNLEGNNFDFGVVGNDGHVKLYLSGNSATTQNLYLSTSQVLIGADYRPAFAPPVGADAYLFVSGVIGSRGTSTKGTSVFGGDTLISGSLHTTEITSSNDSDTSIALGKTANQIDFFAGGNHELSIDNVGLNVADFILHMDDNDTYFVFPTDDRIQSYAGGWKWLDVIEDSTDQVQLGSNGDQVLILSGGGTTSYNEAAGSDVSFYVSGSRNKMGSYGTSVFGGDLLVSGVLHAFGSDSDLPAAAIGNTSGAAGIGADAHMWVSGSVGSRGTSTRGTSIFGGDVVVSGSLTDANGDPITGGISSGTFNVPAIGEFVTTASVALAGDLGFNYTADTKGADAHFFVSGAIGKRENSSHAGVSIFGGDVLSSGTLFIDNSSQGLTDYHGVRILNDGTVSDSNGYFSINMRPSTTPPSQGGASSTIIQNRAGSISIGIGSGSLSQVPHRFSIAEMGAGSNNKSYLLTSGAHGGQVLILSGGGATSTNISDAADVAFYVSGTESGKDNTGTSVFGGDVVVSGGMHVAERIYHEGDSDTSIGFYTDQLTIQAGGKGIVAGLSSGIALLGGAGTEATKFDQVLIMSGGGSLSYNEAAGADVAFYVSGTIGSKGTSTRGTSLFGGDFATSGSLFALNGISGSLTTLVDGTAYLVAGTGITLTTGTNGAVTIDSTAGGGGSDGAGWFAPINGVISTTGSVFFGVSGGTTAPDITFGSNGAANFNVQQEAVDFRVSSDTKLDALFVDGSTNQVLILSGGGVTSFNEAAAADVNFYVSGAIGSQGTSARGTTVFGGDAVISGALYVSTPGVGQDVIFYGEDSSAIGFQWDADGGDHGKLTLGQDDHGVDLQVYGEDSNNYVNWQQATNTLSLYAPQGAINTKGNVVFDVSSQGWDFTVNTNNKTGIFVDGSEDQVLILSGGGATSYNEAGGADVNFYVSGTVGSTGTSTKGTSVFGGDTVISGGLYVNDTIYSAGDTDTKIVFSDDQIDFWAGNERLLKLDETADDEVVIGDGGHVNFRVATFGYGYNFYVKSDHDSGANNAVSIRHSSPQEVFHVSGSVRIDAEARENVLLITGTLGTDSHQVLILSGGNSASYNEAGGADVAFYVSGTAGSKGTSARGTSVFGGDVCTSGTLYPSTMLSNRISGSLTHLTDGSSYLIAGSNVTITTGSSGAVTIASSGGGAADAVGWTGPANQIIVTTGSLSIGTASATPGDADVYFGSDGAAVFNEQGASVDFRVESNTNENALLVKGSTDQVLILSGGGATGVNESSGADVNFFVSGTVGAKDSSHRGTSLFGGDLTISGTIAAGMAGSQTAITTYGNILPGSDNTYDLGSSANRFQNIYTGDLHLRNERGDWTIVEEEDYLCVVNNKSGQKFKMALIPIE